MKRRILLVDDDLAVLLTLKAVLELQGFEVDSANSSSEAFSRLQSGVYQMVISDLRMETEASGLQVLRTARRQSYNPATALLTAYPPSGEEDGWSEEYSDSFLIKPLGINDLLRQVEALLVTHAEKGNAEKRRDGQQDSVRSKYPAKAQEGKRRAR